MARRKEKNGEKSPWAMSYQTSSKRSPPFCLLIRQKNTKVFWHQLEARTTTTVWNWSGKTLSPGALLAVLYFSSCHIFRPFRLSLAPTICPWVSEDGVERGGGRRENGPLSPLSSFNQLTPPPPPPPHLLPLFLAPATWTTRIQKRDGF